MRSSTPTCRSLRVVAVATAASFIVHSVSAAPKSLRVPSFRSRPADQSKEPCILTKVEIQYEDSTSVEEWHCELQGVDSEQSGSPFVTLEGVEDIDLDEQAVSGRTTLFADGAFIASGKMTIPKGVQKHLDKIERRGKPKMKQNNLKGNRQGPPKWKQNNGGGNGQDKNKRQLVEVVQKSVLAIRVVAPDASTSASMSTLSDTIYGTSGDTVNLKERFETCSHGEMLMEPYEGDTPNVSIQDGVIEVQISNDVNGESDGVIRNAAVNAAESYLGVSNLWSWFDHVMICIPPGTSGSWIAYAYMNSWLSVYNDNWCTYPSAQVHEVGHNLNLHHAGEGTNQYADQTGMMGYSYSSTTTNMCYNPAKSTQLGWYSEKRQVLDFSQHGGFRGSLVGIIDYRHVDADDKFVHLVIEGGAEQLYVGFNRDADFNSGTREARNQVTVHGQPSDGAKSSLYAKLGAGGTFRITDFAGEQDLIIEVVDINLSASPAIADVIVMLEGCAPGVCGEQCHTPCDSPTSAPTRTPTEAPTTSPSKNPTILPTSSPTNAPSRTPTQAPTKAPTSSPTEAPSESPTGSPTSSPEGPTPTLLPTADPTSGPTKSPTETPTAAPTKMPTKTPTDSPSKSPTVEPSHSPSKTPTMTPSESPTSSPHDPTPTMSPTANPTASPTNIPTESPTATPTEAPTSSPTETPTALPTHLPTKAPTATPTENPTEGPTTTPTSGPTQNPTTPQNNDWELLFEESFERGPGEFQPGKNVRPTKKANWEGRGSLQIQYDSRDYSEAHTKKTYPVGPYRKALLEFMYYPEGGETFFVDVSNDNAPWKTLRTFQQGIDWNNDAMWYQGSVEWSLSDGTQNIQLRIRTGLSNTRKKDTLYIDSITFQGM